MRDKCRLIRIYVYSFAKLLQSDIFELKQVQGEINIFKIKQTLKIYVYIAAIAKQ